MSLVQRRRGREEGSKGLPRDDRAKVADLLVLFGQERQRPQELVHLAGKELGERIDKGEGRLFILEKKLQRRGEARTPRNLRVQARLTVEILVVIRHGLREARARRRNSPPGRNSMQFNRQVRGKSDSYSRLGERQQKFRLVSSFYALLGVANGRAA